MNILICLMCAMNLNTEKLVAIYKWKVFDDTPVKWQPLAMHRSHDGKFYICLYSEENQMHAIILFCGQFLKFKKINLNYAIKPTDIFSENHSYLHMDTLYYADDRNVNFIKINSADCTVSKPTVHSQLGPGLHGMIDGKDRLLFVNGEALYVNNVIEKKLNFITDEICDMKLRINANGTKFILYNEKNAYFIYQHNSSRSRISSKGDVSRINFLDNDEYAVSTFSGEFYIYKDVSNLISFPKTSRKSIISVQKNDLCDYYIVFTTDNRDLGNVKFFRKKNALFSGSSFLDCDGIVQASLFGKELLVSGSDGTFILYQVSNEK